MDVLLVAVDPGGCAREVAEQAGRLARRLGARVHLMTATRLPTGVRETDLIRTPLHPEGVDAQAALDEDGLARLVPSEAILRAAGVEVRTFVRHGDPADAILAAADEVGASMIVVGTHGRAGVRRLVLGSVAEAVVRRGRVPVLTVRTWRPWEHDGASEVERQVAAEGDG